MAKRTEKKAKAHQTVHQTGGRAASLANLRPRPPWKPGESGNPAGSPKKPFSTALDRFLMGDDAALEHCPPRLLKLVEDAVENARKDPGMLREILMRFEGPVEVDGATEMPTIQVNVQQIVFRGNAPVPPRQVIETNAAPVSTVRARRKPLNVRIERKNNRFEEPEVEQLPQQEEDDAGTED